MTGYFITGTDTGVGKTLVCGGMARAAVMAGRRVGVMKPFETGCRQLDGSLAAADALFLKAMSGCDEPLALICPCRLERPLAPLVAAQLEGRPVDMAQVGACFHHLRERYECLLVEGAGGLLTPVAEGCLIADVVQMFGLPLLVVARLGLGTINHTLLTVRQAQQAGIRVAGIVFSRAGPESGDAESTNPDVIRTLARVPVLGTLPYLSLEERQSPDRLAGAVSRHLDLTAIGLC